MTRSPQSPVFSALEPSSSVDLCAQALRARILDGGFAVGARLPPERELAGQFNVNRVTVRSALGRLKAEGLVQVRQGRGYEVLNFERRSGPALLPSVLAMARERDTETLAAWVEDALAARRHLARAVLTEI